MDKKVAVYLRVSTDQQSTDLQRFEVDLYLKQKVWTDVNYYEDKLSGSNSNRPALQRMLIDCRGGRISTVVCFKLDRMARSLRDIVNTIDELHKMGIGFVSVKDNIDVFSSTGKFIFHVISSFAELELSIIQDRIRAGVEAAKRKGIKLGRPRVINIEDAILLRRQGKSFSEIAKILKVSKSCVHKSLTNLASTNPSINTEIIQFQKSDLVVLQSNVKCTTYDLPTQSAKCHEEVNMCHERDLGVIKGKD